jgi:hypothetical protein
MRYNYFHRGSYQLLLREKRNDRGQDLTVSRLPAVSRLLNTTLYGPSAGCLKIIFQLLFRLRLKMFYLIVNGFDRF